MWVMPLTGVLAPDLILFYFVSLTPSCLPSPFYSSTAALLVVWCMLHRCFPHAIIRLFFKWLLGTDVPVCAFSFPWLKVLCAKSRLHCCSPFDLKSEREKKIPHKWCWFSFQAAWQCCTWVCVSCFFSPPSLVLLADVFFWAFLLQPIFFPLWPNILLPLLLNFLSSNTLVFVLLKSFSDPLPAPHLHLLLPLATPGLLGWISLMRLGTRPVPSLVFSFWVQIHCWCSPSLPQWIHLTIAASTFHFISPIGSRTFSRVRGLAMSKDHLFQVPLNL